MVFNRNYLIIHILGIQSKFLINCVKGNLDSTQLMDVSKVGRQKSDITNKSSFKVNKTLCFYVEIVSQTGCCGDFEKLTKIKQHSQ